MNTKIIAVLRQALEALNTAYCNDEQSDDGYYATVLNSVCALITEIEAGVINQSLTTEAGSAAPAVPENENGQTRESLPAMTQPEAASGVGGSILAQSAPAVPDEWKNALICMTGWAKAHARAMGWTRENANLIWSGIKHADTLLDNACPHVGELVPRAAVPKSAAEKEYDPRRCDNCGTECELRGMVAVACFDSWTPAPLPTDDREEEGRPA